MMTAAEFEVFTRDTVLRARHVGGDVHVFVIITPRGEDVRTHGPLSTGTLDTEGQIAVFRSIADSLEKQHMRELFVKPLDEAKP
jgi:hypothetical protein